MADILTVTTGKPWSIQISTSLRRKQIFAIYTGHDQTAWKLLNVHGQVDPGFPVTPFGKFQDYCITPGHSYRAVVHQGR
jgi:hypothetical protein